MVPYKKKARRKGTFTPSRSRNYRTGGYIDMENKFVDYRVDDDAFTTVWAGGEMEDGTALSLTAVAQGDGESQRDGRVYRVNSVFVHGTIVVPANEASGNPISDEVARLALVWDKQTNGAQLNAEDVFLTIAAADDVDSFRNLQFTKRFQVLADKKFRVNVTSAGMNEGGVNTFANGEVKFNFRMSHVFKKPIKVTCKGTTAAIASIVDNSIHLIGTATSTAVLLNYASRVRFTG